VDAIAWDYWSGLMDIFRATVVGYCIATNQNHKKKKIRTVDKGGQADLALTRVRGGTTFSREGHPPSSETGLLPDSMLGQSLVLPLPSVSLRPIKTNVPSHFSKKPRGWNSETVGVTDQLFEWLIECSIVRRFEWWFEGLIKGLIDRRFEQSYATVTDRSAWPGLLVEVTGRGYWLRPIVRGYCLLLVKLTGHRYE
jgi:hypothetical protein